MTYIRCGTCGKIEEYYTAARSGWLIGSRKGKPGQCVHRCSEHVTKYAKRQATDVFSLPSK